VFLRSLDRISLKTVLGPVLAVAAGSVSPALWAQTAHFSGVQINLPPEGDLTAIAVDGSGSCTLDNGPNHRAGQTCAVDMTFAPKSSGLLYGGAVLTDSAGAVIATGEISGTGVVAE
jgi:hypothetical protein